MTIRRLLLVSTGSIMVLTAAVVVAWGTVTTSTARLSATTGGSGSFVAGTVNLSQVETAVALLFDADGLYPGRVVASCIAVDYDGTVPARVRLHASRTGGSGLEDHVEFRLWVTEAASCPDDGPADRPADRLEGQTGDGVVEPPSDRLGVTPRFDGLLGDLWRAHNGFDEGLDLRPVAQPGDRLVVEAEIEMLDRVEAQGLTTEFSLIVEARP